MSVAGFSSIESVECFDFSASLRCAIALKSESTAIILPVCQIVLGKCVINLAYLRCHCVRGGLADPSTRHGPGQMAHVSSRINSRPNIAPAYIIFSIDAVNKCETVMELSSEETLDPFAAASFQFQCANFPGSLLGPLSTKRFPPSIKGLQTRQFLLLFLRQLPKLVIIWRTHAAYRH